MALIESGYENRQVALSVRDVSKTFSYSNGTLHTNRVLDRINLDIREGEFVTIVGPSGCGKSTLLNIISGLDSPDSGSILMNGEAKRSTDANRIVIFQEGALFPWLSVLDNVEFGLKLANVPKEKRRATANYFINMVQLSKFADSYVYQLSGGMKQRVAIARALALDPKILLMDEPFAALDVQTRDMLHAELLRIHQETGKTMLFVTHNINEAILLGTRVIVLSPALGNIKKEFIIDTPRPRDVESLEMTAVKRQILNELEQDFQQKLAKTGGATLPTC
ncbi:MAG: ABC transporter ATP-binding protein [Nitrososphaera sp.]